MVAYAGKRFYGPAQPGTSAGDLFTVGGGKQAHVRSITVANTTAIAATVTVSIGADGASTRILDAVAVPPFGTLLLNGYWYLDAAEKMQGKQGTSSALTVTISGVEES